MFNHNCYMLEQEQLLSTISSQFYMAEHTDEVEAEGPSFPPKFHPAKSFPIRKFWVEGSETIVDRRS